jgi:hypothetical protein
MEIWGHRALVEQPDLVDQQVPQGLPELLAKTGVQGLKGQVEQQE